MDTHSNNLLGRAIDGDQDALVMLLQRHGPAVRHSLTGRIPRRWQSVLSEDDVMQQTYADALVHIGGFNGDSEASFAKWLRTIAERNVYAALKMLEAEKRGGSARKVARAPDHDSRLTLLELLSSTATTPSHGCERAEALNALAAAMRQLPEIYARAITLYDLQEAPVGEVARTLQRSPGAVFMLLARARERLHSIMGRTSQFLSGSA